MGSIVKALIEKVTLSMSSKEQREEERLELVPLTDDDDHLDDPSALKRTNNNTKSILWSVCSYILVTEFCERLAYYGLTGSLPIFFRKHLGFSNVFATELNSLFSSFTYITPLLGAWIADNYLGRYSTILCFSLWYLLGLVTCVIASYPTILSTKLFLTGLFLGVAVGTGGIKPNVVVFGADQFPPGEQPAEKDQFFNWFYWCINGGATFSFGVLTNVAMNGIPEWHVPMEFGFFVSFLIPALGFTLAICIFVLGYRRYRHIKPRGSSLGDFVSIVLACRHECLEGQWLLLGCLCFPLGLVLSTVSVVVSGASSSSGSSSSSSCLNPISTFAALMIGTGMLLLVVVGSRDLSWLDEARRRRSSSSSSSSSSSLSSSSSSIEDTRRVVRLFPYLCFMILFWTIYGQQSTNFIIQGCQMDLRIGEASEGRDQTQISSAMLAILDSSVILICIPIFDQCIYPWIESKMGVKISLMRKIGAGLFLSGLSMIVAGATELWRKSCPDVQNVSSHCAATGETLVMSSLSIWWQTPQYLLIGMGEILTSISAYDLFYSQVPEHMKSTCQALNLLTTTFGYTLAGSLNSILRAYITPDLNDGQLEVVFFTLASCMGLNLLVFLVVSQAFEYQDTQEALEAQPPSFPPPPPPPASSSSSSLGKGTDLVSGFSPALSRSFKTLREAKRRQAQKEVHHHRGSQVNR